jgi:large subunit ribosomal protein L22
MEAQATARFVRMGPRKVRFVLDTIRGKYAQDALDQLKFTPNHAADEIANVLRSAIANAANNHGMETDYLKVVRCFVDCGPTMKRVQPRAQGRAYRILKRTSHITVVVEEAEAPPTKTGKLKTRRAPLRAALPMPVVAEAAPVIDETTLPVETASEETTPVAENATGADQSAVSVESAAAEA